LIPGLALLAGLGLLGQPQATAPARPSGQAPVGAAAPGAPAAAPARQDPAQIKHRLTEIQARLGAVDQQLEALKKRRKGVLVELQAIGLEADRVRAQAEAARLRRDQTRLEVEAITARKSEIQQELIRLRAGLRKQVRWLQAKGPLGDLSFYASLSSFEQYVAQERYQAYLRDQERGRLDQVQALQRDLLRREQQLQAALVALAADEQGFATATATFQAHQARLETFLDGLKQDESRQEEVQAELAEEALQLERMLTQLLGRPRADSFEAPSGAFASLAGQLPQPTPGTLAQAYGEHLHPLFKTRTMQSGLLIAGEQGAPVTAVADGRVVYADLYQSFGPMVILDHGAGYFTLYTHLEALAVTKGQVLRQGEPLGSVGVTVDGPRLGFELRHLTQAMDPNKWFKQHYK
jgi:septal ring factor EnvC (AmiA/AmiB activator)